MRTPLDTDRAPRRRLACGILGVACAALLVTGCGNDGDQARPAPSIAGSAGTTGSEVVDYEGIREIRFGDTEQELTARGLLIKDVPECGPRMKQPTGASPVFVDGRLALVWADPPLRTPEGIGVGTSLTEMRSAYPQAAALTAPAGSYRFDGLLAVRGDRAYLFLHDSQRVQKLIVGFVRHVRTLFERGFAGC